MSVAAARTDRDNGTAEAANDLFERHRRRIYAFCLSRTRNPADAEDALQTTFMYALRGLQRGVVPQFESTWLLRIAENVCHSMRRRAYRRYESDELPADVFADRGTDPALAAEQITKVCAAVETLPEKQRIAILLREWRGLSYDDIAAELRVSHSAVETLLFRARRTVADRIGPLTGVALQLPWGSRALRWLLAPGGAKAAAVAAIAVGVVTASPSATADPVGPTSRTPSASLARATAATTSPRLRSQRVRPTDRSAPAHVMPVIGDGAPERAVPNEAAPHPSSPAQGSQAAPTGSTTALPESSASQELVASTLETVDTLAQTVSPLPVVSELELPPIAPVEIDPPQVDLPTDLPLPLP